MVRKAAVFCIVRFYIVLGEERIKPKFSLLNSSKIRWVTEIELHYSQANIDYVYLCPGCLMYTSPKHKTSNHDPEYRRFAPSERPNVIQAMNLH